MMNSVLKIATIAAILSTGCTTTVVQNDVPCPPRPVLASFTIVELNIMATSTQEKIAANQIKLKAYSEKLEVRALCNESD